MPIRARWPDLKTLTALGFGPDAALMTEPKLLVDGRFLSAVLLELDRELAPEAAAAALFQIGLLHGLRDARRVLGCGFLRPAPEPGPGSEVGPPVLATPLALRFGPRAIHRSGGPFSIPGCWPERFEADARLARLGAAHAPSCGLSAGYTSGWLSGVLDADILAVESECAAQGSQHCRFWAREVAAWRTSSDRRATDLVEAVRFDAFRDLAARTDSEASGVAPLASAAGSQPDDPAAEFGAFDAEAPVIHLWGSVMVLPFGGAEEALRNLDQLARDPATAGVRAVVVDLRQNIVDEAFGALALEQVLDAVERWGAEVILAGVSPLSEEAVRGLERSHLVIRKDLPEAIAAAFQIADAQRLSV